MENIGERIEAAITTAINKHLGDDDDITWPVRVEITVSVTISPHRLN